MREPTQVDRFCEVRDDSPYWNESCWFSFSIPERGIHGMVYYFFRPNMKLMMGGPILWDGSGAHSWDCLYYDWHHLQPIPPNAEKFNFTATNSLDVKIIEPLRQYRLRYDANGFKTDLLWTAIEEPHHFLGMEIEATGASAENRMHLEQRGRVRGRIEYNGEAFDVDSFALRDTSWGRRQTDSVKRGSYFWAIQSQDIAFHAQTMGEGDTQRVVGGFLTLDGKTATLAGGERVVTDMGESHAAHFPARARRSARAHRRDHGKHPEPSDVQRVPSLPGGLVAARSRFRWRSQGLGRHPGIPADGAVPPHGPRQRCRLRGDSM